MSHWYVHVQIYIDTVGDAERYEARLSQRYPTIQYASQAWILTQASRPKEQTAGQAAILG